jgi:hypothetical protein
LASSLFSLVDLDVEAQLFFICPVTCLMSFFQSFMDIRNVGSRSQGHVPTSISRKNYEP